VSCPYFELSLPFEFLTVGFLKFEIPLRVNECGEFDFISIEIEPLSVVLSDRGCLRVFRKFRTETRLLERSKGRIHFEIAATRARTFPLSSPIAS